MKSALHRFVDEIHATLARLGAYLAVLALVGYGVFALLSGGLINVLVGADQEREWVMPKPAPAIVDRVHPSLRPKLRGPVDE